MNLQMRSLCAIGFDMHSIHWHGHGRLTEDRRLVHIVPEAIDVATAFENFVIEQIAPELLSILIQKVNPYRVARPAPALKRLDPLCTFSYEDV